jgi:hypothetical protein
MARGNNGLGEGDLARSYCGAPALTPLATANDEIAWAAFLDVELLGKPVEGLKDVLSNTEKTVARFTTRAGISI